MYIASDRKVPVNAMTNLLVPHKARFAELSASQANSAPLS
jgi:hypothetical protein